MDAFKKPQQPPPLDTAKIGQDVTAAIGNKVNLDTTTNRPRQVGPYGTTEWSEDRDGNWTQTTTLDPRERAYSEELKGLGKDTFKTGLAALGDQPKVGRVETDPYGFMGLGASQISGFTPSDTTSAFEEADKFWQKYEQPLQDSAVADERTRLAVLGHDARNDADPNSGYARSMDALARRQGEEKARWRMGQQERFFNQGQTTDTNKFSRATQTFGTGADWAKNLFGMDLSGAAQEGQRALSLANLGRGIMLGEKTATGAPSFTPTSIPFSDPTQLALAGNQDLWKRFGVQNDAYNNAWNTIGTGISTVANFGMPGGGTVGGNMVSGLFGLGNQGGQQLPWQRVGYNNPNWVT